MTVLTPPQVAREYRISLGKVLALCRKPDGIPHFRVGNRYRIVQEEMDKWLREQTERRATL